MMDAACYEKRREIMNRNLGVLAEMGYHFEQFGLQHRDLYQKYEAQTELSCHSLLSYYGYAEEDLIYCWENPAEQCLYVIFLNFDNMLSAYPPMLCEYTPERFAAAVDNYCAMFAKLGQTMRFEYANEEDVGRFQKLPREIQVSAPRRELDYIYEFEDLKEFAGGKNVNRRRKHNHFLNHNQTAMERIYEGNTAECGMVLDQWCLDHSCMECMLRCPRNVAKRVLCNLDKLNAMGYLIRVNGDPQTVILLGHMSEDMLDVLTVCSINRDMGMEETMYAMVAEAVSPPYKYMNLEEDMGIERLRVHKQMLRPCRMQPKYSVLFS